jgi:hypothetical protein
MNSNSFNIQAYFQVFNFQKWPLSRAELGDYGVEELSSLLHHASVSPYFSDEEKEAIGETEAW